MLQVLLGDMPADHAADTLASGVWAGLSMRISLAAVVGAVAISAAVTHVLPSESLRTECSLSTSGSMNLLLTKSILHLF